LGSASGCGRAHDQTDRGAQPRSRAPFWLQVADWRSRRQSITCRSSSPRGCIIRSGNFMRACSRKCTDF
jgi:hypothetical protein